MTTPTLEDLLRLALLTPEETALRALTKELIRQGYNDPPKPTPAQIIEAARVMAEIFKGIPKANWVEVPDYGVAVDIDSGDLGKMGRLSIFNTRTTEDGVPLFVFSIIFDSAPGAGFYPHTSFACATASNALKALRQTIQPSPHRSPPTTPADAMRAWRLLFVALNQPQDKWQVCPRCEDAQRYGEVSPRHPLCVRCLPEVIGSQERGMGWAASPTFRR